ncbi:putative nucleotidyltransferase [anaerobic digester metagenome]
MFILLCVHVAGHRWERLNWLCDISEMVKSQDLKWDLIFSKAEKLGVKRILILNLLLANDLLGMEIPDYIKHNINLNTKLNGIIFQIKQSIFRNEKNLYSKATLRLKIRERNIDKIMDFFRIIFLPTHKEYVSLKIPISLFPLYYLYRFFKVIKDY